MISRGRQFLITHVREISRDQTSELIRCCIREVFLFFFFFLFDDYRTTPNTATFDIESIGNERLTIFYKIAMVPLFLVSTCTSNDLEFVVLRCIDTTIYVHVYIYIYVRYGENALIIQWRRIRHFP